MKEESYPRGRIYQYLSPCDEEWGYLSKAYRRTILPCGVRVVTEDIPHVRSCSIGIWVNAGSRWETPEENGVSHFIEHLVFKGTARRSARQIAEEMDGVGGQLNAFTGKDHTCFYAKVLDEHVDLAMDILCDLVCHPLLAPEDVEKERGVVAEEIGMYEDSPEEVVHDEFARAAWGGRSVGLPVLGTQKTLRNLTRDTIVRYMRDNYTCDNVVVAAAGHVSHERIVEAVENHLVLPISARPAGARPSWRAGVRAFRQRNTEQVHLCLGVEGYDRKHPHRFALYLLDITIGGGMSSRLFQKLREDRGLVYSTYSYAASFEDVGALIVYAATSPDRVHEVEQLVREELEEAARHGVSDEELRRSREQLKSSLVLNLETTNSRMSRLGRLELFGEPLETPDQVFRKIDGVTGDDVRKVAAELLGRAEPVTVAVGPRKAKSSFIRRERDGRRDRREAAVAPGCHRGAAHGTPRGHSPG
ncbi:MAG: M16 family metallopeptidase [Bacteroidota bacterium]